MAGAGDRVKPGEQKALRLLGEALVLVNKAYAVLGACPIEPRVAIERAALEIVRAVDVIEKPTRDAYSAAKRGGAT